MYDDNNTGSFMIVCTIRKCFVPPFSEQISVQLKIAQLFANTACLIPTLKPSRSRSERQC